MDDISVKDGKHLVAVNWDRGHPWHMLGERVNHDMTQEEALTLVGVLEEDIRHKPLYVVQDDATTAEFEVRGVKERWIRVSHLDEVPDDVAVAINSTVFGTISTASSFYHPIQRRDLLTMAYDITGLMDEEHKGYVDTIGNLGSYGDTFFAYIRVPDIVIDPNGVADVIENGLFVATSYDQSMSNTIGYSPIRPVCRNTVMMGLGQLSQTIRARHTKNSEARMREAAKALEYVGAIEKELIQRAEQMLRIDGEKALNTVLDHFLNIDDPELGEKAVTTRTRQRNTVRRLLEEEDNTTTELLGFNGYSVYQAWIEFKDHLSDVGQRHGADITRARNAVLPGEVVKSKIRASELILALGA